jgi:hypothetical protein
MKRWPHLFAIRSRVGCGHSSKIDCLLSAAFSCFDALPAGASAELLAVAAFPAAMADFNLLWLHAKALALSAVSRY